MMSSNPQQKPEQHPPHYPDRGVPPQHQQQPMDGPPPTDQAPSPLTPPLKKEVAISSGHADLIPTHVASSSTEKMLDPTQKAIFNNSTKTSAREIPLSPTTPTDITNTGPINLSSSSMTTYHIFPAPEDDLIVNMSDTVTTLYYLSRNGVFNTDSTLRVHSFDKSGPLIAEVKNSHGLSKEKSALTYTFPTITTDTSMHPDDGELNHDEASNRREITLHRAGSLLTRKHKITLSSDNRTYTIKGKTSGTTLCYWGNLQVIDDETQLVVADFESRWLKSFSNVGTISLVGEVEKGEKWREEMLVVILGLAHKEYRKAWWFWTGIPPFHS